MESQPPTRCWSLEALVASLRQQYPAARLHMVEEQPDQVVLYLDHFTITVTNQGMVEVCAPLNAHERVEQLANVIEHFLSLVPDPCSSSAESRSQREEEGDQR